MALTDKLTAIANAIRGKTGKTDSLTLDQMATEIAGIQAGGGGQWTTDGIANASEPNGDLTINVTAITSYAFYKCAEITSVNAPNLVNLSANAFYDCKKMTSINLPVCIALGQNCMSYTPIEVLDLPSAAKLEYGALTNMSSLKTLILRRPEGVTLLHTYAFQGTAFASGGAGGTIYVPQALIDSGFYTTATNWSVVNGYGTITWKAIEGSEYE